MRRDDRISQEMDDVGGNLRISRRSLEKDLVGNTIVGAKKALAGARSPRRCSEHDRRSQQRVKAGGLGAGSYSVAVQLSALGPSSP